MKAAMQTVADAVRSVADVNPSTLSGAIDVVVVRQPDGTLRRIGSYPTVANTFFRGTGMPADPARAEEVLGFFEALADSSRRFR